MAKGKGSRKDVQESSVTPSVGCHIRRGFHSWNRVLGGHYHRIIEGPSGNFRTAVVELGAVAFWEPLALTPCLALRSCKGFRV